MQLLAEYIDPYLNPFRVLDIGSGTAEPEWCLLKIRPNVDIVALDISSSMIRAPGHTEAPWNAAIVARAEALPIRDGSIPLLLSVKSFHLMDERRTLAEVSRVLSPAGLMALIVTEPPDLRSQLFHRLFPEFARIESKRNKSLSDIAAAASRQGLSLLGQARFPFAVRFRSKAEIIEFVRGKPFFGMWALSDEAFKKGLQGFERRISLLDDTSGIISPSALSIGIWRKESRGRPVAIPV
jgi:SAM-dependent methyltransferase